MKKARSLLILLLALILGASTFHSCSDDEGDNELQSRKLLPVRTTLRSNNAVTLFSYDDQNRLTGIRTVSPDEETIADLHVYYDESGRIYQVVKESSAYEGQEVISYTYDSSNKIAYTHKKTDNTIRYEGRLITDEKGNMTWHETKQVHELSTEPNIAEYEYDTKGNIRKMVINEQYTSYYTYDNKNGILKSVNTPQWFFLTAPLFDLFPLELRNFVNNMRSMGESAKSEVSDSDIRYYYDAYAYPESVSVPAIHVFGYPSGNEPPQIYDIEYTQASLR